MPTGGLIAAGIAAPILGGMLGNALSGDDKDKALAAQQAALASLQGVGVPSVEAQKIILQKLASQGQLTPEVLETISQEDSELENISTDPRLKEMQMKALTGLLQRGEQGLTSEDRAALNDVRRGNDRDLSARNSAVLQNMSQRGMGGSGAELAAILANSQAGADRASQEGDRLAAMANQRALEAVAQSGSLGGQMQEQEFSQKSQQASAQDAVNRFNAANSQGVAQYNVGGRNDAQKYNLGEKQRIADANVGIGNQQEIHNQGLIQNKFDNEYRRAGGVASGQQNMSSYYGNQAKETAGMWSGIGQGVGAGAMAGAGMMSSAPSELAAGTKTAGQAYKDPNVMHAAHGGQVPQPAKEFKIHPSVHKLFAMLSGAEQKSLPMSEGGQVPGVPNVPGDSLENDVVEARLSPGEIVIPISIVNSSDDAIMDFIKHVKKGKGR